MIYKESSKEINDYINRMKKPLIVNILILLWLVSFFVFTVLWYVGYFNN
jgi:succinate dehydrogenase hydrophobic anchor subunit